MIQFSLRRSVVLVAIASSMMCRSSAHAQAQTVTDRLRACFGKSDPTEPQHDEISLATDAIKRCPKSSLAHSLRGQALLRSGAISDALKEFDMAVQLNSEWDTATKRRVEWLRNSLRAIVSPGESGASATTTGTVPREEGAVSVIAPSESVAHADDCPTPQSFPAPTGIDPNAWGTLVNLIGAGCEVKGFVGGLAPKPDGKSDGKSDQKPTSKPKPWKECVNDSNVKARTSSEDAGIEFLSCLDACNPERQATVSYANCTGICGKKWKATQNQIFNTSLDEIKACPNNPHPNVFPIIVQDRSAAIIKKATGSQAVCDHFANNQNACLNVVGCGWCDQPAKCFAGSPLGPASGPIVCAAANWFYQNVGFASLTP